MTLRANARLAGFMFLFYIVAGIMHMIVFNQATRGAEGTAAQLASIAQHASLVRVTFLLALLESLAALVLGVTLYALTREVDRDLAVMALCCRAGEGEMGLISAVRTLGLVSVAKGAAGAAPADAAAANALGALLLNVGAGGVGAIAFAVGSLLFSYLFLRARSIPVPLAWLGVLASAVWVVALPLRAAGFLRGPMITYAAYLPMAVFEVTLAVWLLIKGVAPPPQRQSASA